MIDFNNQLRVKSLFKSFVKNQYNKNKCSHTISSIYEQHNVNFVNNGVKLLSDLRKDLLLLFGLNSKEQKKSFKPEYLDFYGLSGSGFQFKDNLIKVMCRHKDYQKIFKNLKQLQKDGKLKKGDFVH